MNGSLNRNLHFALTSSSLSRRQIRLSHLHARAHIVRQLQNSRDPVSVASVHTNVLRLGFSNDTVTTNHLINGYVRLGRVEAAHLLFDEMPEPNVISWTSLISGYAKTDNPRKALWLFGNMVWGTVVPNSFTFATVVNACSVLAYLETGKQVQAQIEIFGFQSNLVVCSSLIDMYGKSNEVDEARRVFDLMNCKSIVSWTCMINSYAQNAQGHHALELFREFNKFTMNRPNNFMLATVINACASLGRLVTGKVAHGAAIRGGHDLYEVVATSLVDMYGKCGCIEYSVKVFKKIQNPSVIPYTSMIVGAAKFGAGELSLRLFHEMTKKRGVSPNDVTFIGVLHACSHSGLVDEGLKHLNSMESQYGVVPNTKHYTCVVDMLGRIGRLDEAYRIAKSMRVKPEEGALLWGTILSASRVHGRLDIAVEASKWLIESNQQVAATYVTMSNTFASVGIWENFESIRFEMKRNRISKEPGCSWIEIKDYTYVFYAGNKVSCPRGEEVVSLLEELERRMKERGYVGGSKGLAFVDVEEETKEEIVGLHSERWALGFGLIIVPKGVTIRVMKNLRICRDCHEAFKLISEIMERDFVVRDLNRFHHFKDGSCTCRDFW